MALRMNAALLSLCVSAAGCAELLAERRPTEPERETIVNIGRLVEQSGQAYSSYARGGHQLRRLYVSPNLLEEMTRSSLPEGAIAQGGVVTRVPPEGAPPGAQGGVERSSGFSLSSVTGETKTPPSAKAEGPAAASAVGLPVDLRLSSLIVEFFHARGVVILTQATSRLLGVDATCPAPAPGPSAPSTCAQGCPNAACAPTWLERTLLSSQRSPRADDGTSAALAIREFKVDTLEVPVVVERNSVTGELEVRVRTYDDEKSICTGLRAPVPVVWLSGEAVALSDGRLLARIEDARSPLSRISAKRRVRASPNDPCGAIAKELKAAREYVLRTPELRLAVADQIRAVIEPMIMAP